MTAEQSLLDLLSIQMGCMYLSDLRFLSQGQRRYLAQRVNRLTPRQDDVREWNDALDYLTGAPPEGIIVSKKARTSVSGFSKHVRPFFLYPPGFLSSGCIQVRFC